MGLWFVSSAILPELLAQSEIGPIRQAALTSAVQAGFVIGALAIAFSGIADRWDPRRVIFASAVLAAVSSALLVVTTPGSTAQIALRMLTGIGLAGVYPVGMKLVVGWGIKDRGLLVALLVAALTLGSSTPYLLAFLGGSNVTAIILVSAFVALIGTTPILWSGLGPHHKKAPKFDPTAIPRALRNEKARLAILGYLGHMWELYAFWAWLAVAATASFTLQMSADEAKSLGAMTAFLAIALGALCCIPAGYFADIHGKALIALVCLVMSTGFALLLAIVYGESPWLVMICLIAWGMAIIPDSAQFSALVADALPPEDAGSIMTFQTALGFTLTIATIQLVPFAAAQLGWPVTFVLMAVGPLLGCFAMVRLMRLWAATPRLP